MHVSRQMQGKGRRKLLGYAMGRDSQKSIFLWKCQCYNDKTAGTYWKQSGQWGKKGFVLKKAEKGSL